MAASVKFIKPELRQDDAIIEVKDIRDIRPRIRSGAFLSAKASLTGLGSRSSFHSIRFDNSDR